MLVLTRKKGQSLNIGDNIRIVVVDVAGDTVRVGIEA
ncbi:MAG: carbon storage regulator, partial [Eubacteriales bacterium]